MDDSNESLTFESLFSKSTKTNKTNNKKKPENTNSNEVKDKKIDNNIYSNDNLICSVTSSNFNIESTKKKVNKNDNSNKDNFNLNEMIVNKLKYKALNNNVVSQDKNDLKKNVNDKEQDDFSNIKFIKQSRQENENNNNSNNSFSDYNSLLNKKRDTNDNFINNAYKNNDTNNGQFIIPSRFSQNNNTKNENIAVNCNKIINRHNLHNPNQNMTNSGLNLNQNVIPLINVNINQPIVNNIPINYPLYNNINPYNSMNVNPNLINNVHQNQINNLNSINYFLNHTNYEKNKEYQNLLKNNLLRTGIPLNNSSILNNLINNSNKIDLISSHSISNEETSLTSNKIENKMIEKIKLEEYHNKTMARLIKIKLIHLNHEKLKKIQVFKLPKEQQFVVFMKKYVPIMAGDSFKAYIERCFDSCFNNLDLEKIEYNLDKILEDPINSSSAFFFKKSWDSVPIPNQNISSSELNSFRIQRDKLEPCNDILNFENSNSNENSENQEKSGKFNSKKNNHSFEKDFKDDHSNSKTEKKNVNAITNSINNNNNKNTNKKKQKCPNDNTCIDYSDGTKEEIYYTNGIKPIVGTCQEIEKIFFRTSSLPDPANVRPEHILKKSYELMKTYIKNNEKDYKYLRDQFKSIRQDLIIQMIRNNFSVKVYETNAILSIENHDLDQFNQCQNELSILYNEGFKGNRVQFITYKIIYMALVDSKYDFEPFLKNVYKDKNLIKHEEIRNALEISLSLNDSNYMKFFRLYNKCSEIGKKLCDPFLSRLRVKALIVLCNGL